MKVTTSKKLDPSLLSKRLVKQYTYTHSVGESNDGMRRGYSYDAKGYVYGEIENETKNEDGTYTYDYSSYNTKEDSGIEYKNPSKSEYDLKKMVEELMFNYNIHEFSTDLQQKPNSIKDYYVSMEATSTYKKDEKLELYYSNWSIFNKDKAYSEETSEFYRKPIIKSESIDNINAKLDSKFSKSDYIYYLMGYKIEKQYEIKIGLDEIEENETVGHFLNKMSLKSPKYVTFEDALKENIISMEDIENQVRQSKNLTAQNIPHNILEELFKKDQELISHFDDADMPIDILRKYNPEFDITTIAPNDLIPSDLDNVLQTVIENGFRGVEKQEWPQEYCKYLEKFYDNPEALRKIIPAMNTSREYFFVSKAKEYADKIPPEVLEENEIRDILLNTKDISLKQILKYQFDYDNTSAKKLVEILSNAESDIFLSTMNPVIDIVKQNGISNEEIVQALRENGFNIGMTGSSSDEPEIQKFQNFELEGVSLDELRDPMLKNRNFNFLKLFKGITSEEVTRQYNGILNEISEKNINKEDRETKRCDAVFELIYDYLNTDELFSRLTPEVKDLSKKMIIENIDKQDEEKSRQINSLSRLINVITRAFEISEVDMDNIYMKCLNNGISGKEILKQLEYNLPKEEKELEGRLAKVNIYPNPNYNWLNDRNVREIRIDAEENRNTLKSKIQVDGRCFSIKVKTDMIGKSKEGKKIIVNNLSKWLFGVPGAKGNLIVTSRGNYIKLPANTPDEVVELIEDIVKQRGKDEQLI